MYTLTRGATRLAVGYNRVARDAAGMGGVYFTNDSLAHWWMRGVAFEMNETVGMYRERRSDPTRECKIFTHHWKVQISETAQVKKLPDPSVIQHISHERYIEAVTTGQSCELIQYGNLSFQLFSTDEIIVSEPVEIMEDADLRKEILSQYGGALIFHDTTGKHLIHQFPDYTVDEVLLSLANDLSIYSKLEPALKHSEEFLFEAVKVQWRIYFLYKKDVEQMRKQLDDLIRTDTDQNLIDQAREQVQAQQILLDRLSPLVLPRIGRR